MISIKISIKKHKKILIPTIIALGIIILIIVAVLILIKKPQPSGSMPKPQPNFDVWETCKQMRYDINKQDQYNFLGALDFVEETPHTEIIEIKPTPEKQLISLGKFTLNLEPNTVLVINKLWLYFSSEKLSDRDDNLYGLEDSYLSKIIIKKGNLTQEIKLGDTGEHSFIELDNCPLGNIYAVDYATQIDFEIMLEVGCNNLKDGVCLDNNGKPLNYIDGADLTAQLRLFAASEEAFNKDISIPMKFKYK
jgi:hypothetical protein